MDEIRFCPRGSSYHGGARHGASDSNKLGSDGEKEASTSKGDRRPAGIAVQTAAVRFSRAAAPPCRHLYVGIRKVGRANPQGF